MFVANFVNAQETAKSLLYLGYRALNCNVNMRVKMWEIVSSCAENINNL